MGAIDVGDIMKAWAIMVGGERQRGHRRSEIGAANPNVDNIGNGAAAHFIGKPPHGGQHRIDLRHHILAVDQHRAIGAVAKCCMQNSTALRRVDGCAVEHRVALCFDLSRRDQVSQQLHGAGVHRALGIVEQQVIKPGRKCGEALRILREGGAHIGGRPLLAVGGEVLEGLCNDCLGHYQLLSTPPVAF